MFKKGLAKLGNFVLDPSIFLSFDKFGFYRHRVFFNADDLSTDLTNKICLITGANSGLGFATAQGLAQRNATVWLLCRNKERGQQAQKDIQKNTGNPNIHLAIVDVSEQKSVRQFCANFTAPCVDRLILNAGILPAQQEQTSDGIEKTLATHLVGHFLMTHLLLPFLRKGQAPRVILVSSGGMYSQKLNVEELEHPPQPFDGVLAYARAKRAMVILNRLWCEPLRKQGISSHCMHPGWADTPGVKSSIPGFWKVTQKILRNAEEGADTTLWLAICDAAHHTPGLFWFDRKARSEYLIPGKKAPRDEETKLWKKLCDWAGVSQDVFEGEAP